MGFDEVLKVHDHLGALFLRHQESLLRLDLDAAVESLELYRRELEAHIEIEELLLLPVYERAGAIQGGPAEFFTGEHERMRQYLDRIAQSLEKLRNDRGDLARGVISVFDEEAAYKSLNGHHDQRERNLFYPTLDRVTGEAERTELVERCLAANSLKTGAGGDESGK